jgi:hypothetical protein
VSPSLLRRPVRRAMVRTAGALAIAALVTTLAPRLELRSEEVLSVSRSGLQAVPVAELAAPIAAAAGTVQSEEHRQARSTGGEQRISLVVADEADPVAPVDEPELPETPEERAAEALAEDRSIGGNLEATEFTMIGLTFDEPPVEPVFVRVRDDLGWSDWYELHPDGSEGPDPGAEGDGRPGTPPIWVKGGDGYLVSIGGEDAGLDATVVTVERGARTRLAAVGSDAGAQQLPVAGQVPARPRSAWNARPPLSSVSLASSIRYAVVHHTVTSNTYAQADVPAILRSIQAFHQDGRGWSDIAYNFLVDRFGTIWEGRARSLEGAAIGAHAAGFNSGSVGVANLGSYDIVEPSPVQVNATAEIISWRFAAFRTDPSTPVKVTAGAGSTKFPVGQQVTIPPVVGHSDVGATACPGTFLGQVLGTIRSQVTARVPNLSGPFGNVETFSLSGRTLRVSGWVTDPDTTGPVGVLIDASGRVQGIVADRRRADVEAVYGLGGNSGFSAEVQVPAGTKRICLYGLNIGPGKDLTLTCRDVVVK